ncbi:tetratricopeptide repeat protein [Pseudanabaena galeata UHCC 0370]|uniref:Tetratricopeptide repeat protein n=1 Tax=Pseudanabaena galeata UHCC 0370 TaxID=3110310 RepID=A0ABU5TNF1_9CYAN|nr:tetratricopeptide repeat protein [Pseudanabaena galeata]MEA5479831.1 tetratricopeptide repeat protein [Pseudanabaena galeata UHCC 0370]
MQQNLTEWDEDVVSTPEEDYQSFLRGLSWRDGFGIEFVRCSPASGQDLIAKVKRDLPQKKIEVLTLSEPIDNLINIVQSLPNHSELDVLFVVGLDKSLTDYIRTGYGGQGEYYNLDTVPPILSHLNWQRENFRDRFPNLCFVFLLPQFAIKYIIRRAPDFYDWASGKVDFPTSKELVEQESTRILWGKYEEYLLWTPQQRKERIIQINELLLEPNQTQNHQDSLLFEQGTIFYINEQYEEAIASYDKAIKINPDNDRAWGFRGLALEKLGRYEKAIISYDNALQFNSPENYCVWSFRGTALANLGSNEEALASYNNALQINPDYYEALDNRSITLDKLGRYEEALASYEKTLHINLNSSDVWYGRGCVLGKLGRYEESIDSFNKALQFKPDYIEALNGRGIGLCNLGKHEESLADFDRALEINPKNHKSYFNKACVYSLQNQIELALENLQKAIQFNTEKYREMAMTDSDFDNIRHDPRFQALIQ